MLRPRSRPPQSLNGSFTNIFSVESAVEVYNQTDEVVYLGGNVDNDTDLSIQVDRRIRNAWCRFRMYTFELYDQPSASLELKLRMLRAEVLETVRCGVTWSLRACHYDTLHRAHHSFLTHYIDWRKNNRTDHTISYLDTLMKTGSESIGEIRHRRRILFAGFGTRMEDTRLSKCVMFGEVVGGADCVGGQQKEWMGCLLNDLRAFIVNAHQCRRLQSRTSVNGARRRNKGRNVSWRNGSL